MTPPTNLIPKLLFPLPTQFESLDVIRPPTTYIPLGITRTPPPHPHPTLPTSCALLGNTPPPAKFNHLVRGITQLQIYILL